jgi:hypothetical protein
VSTPGYADSGRGVYVEKPKSNVYTVLLALALLSLIIACIFLLLEMNAYEFDRRATAMNTGRMALDAVRTWLA